jgi:glycosyltransferase involved in cell wall biosynthesis
MISDVFFPRVNGVSTSIHTFIEAHNKLGNQVTLVCPQYDLLEVVDPTETNVIRLPARNILFDPEDRLIKSASYSLLKQATLNIDFDIIHVQTPFMAHRFGLRLAKELNIPVIETYHTYFEETFIITFLLHLRLF